MRCFNGYNAFLWERNDYKIAERFLDIKDSRIPSSVEEICNLFAKSLPLEKLDEIEKE